MPTPNLLVLFSPEIEATRSFYERLGLKFVRERHGTGPEHFACDVDGFVLEIYPQRDDQPSGTVRLGFSVDSVDDIDADLRLDGVSIISEPADRPWGRSMIVADPDGNRVHLTEPIG